MIFWTFYWNHFSFISWMFYISLKVLHQLISLMSLFSLASHFSQHLGLPLPCVSTNILYVSIVTYLALWRSTECFLALVAVLKWYFCTFSSLLVCVCVCASFFLLFFSFSLFFLGVIFFKFNSIIFVSLSLTTWMQYGYGSHMNTKCSRTV